MGRYVLSATQLIEYQEAVGMPTRVAAVKLLWDATMKESGQRFAYREVQIFILDGDGKAAELRCYADTTKEIEAARSLATG